MDFPQGVAPQYGPSDILMEFNSGTNFYFENPKTGTSIQSNEYDFLTIAIHEYLPNETSANVELCMVWDSYHPGQII